MMKDRVIYTSVVGDLDTLMQPQVVDPRYDYVCFVRKAEGLDGGIWQLREIPVVIPGDRMLSRYPKLHPEELLPEYEWTLWIDGNISISSRGFYDRIDELIAAGVQMAATRHPLRDCVYDEAYAVVAADKERYSVARRVIKFMLAKGFPRHAGLFENSILLRRGGDQALEAMDAMWWNCLQTLSGRDQLSLVYCARECGVTIVPLLPDGMLLRNCDWLTYVYHDRRPERPWLVKKYYDARRRLAKWSLRRVLRRIG
jgi:hypothetical protein